MEPVPDHPGTAGFPSGAGRRVIVVAQVILVGGVLALWLGVDSLRESRNLWMLFLYCLPSEFLVATVPHEPVILFFARFYDPIVVAAVSLAGTVLTEFINYSIIRTFADTRSFRRISGGPRVRRIVELFGRAPFPALLVAALTPVPFYPFRFLAVMSRYPVGLYLLAVLVGRGPRFYLIAFLGELVQIPNIWLVAIFVVLIAAIYLPPLVRRIRSSR